MNRTEMEQLVALGEDSRRQFKKDVRNSDSLAADLVAFSNSEGGVILIGVADDKSIPGLAPEDVRRINQLIGNAATQHVRSPILASYAAKGVLPYRGLGTGIRRALTEWDAIHFTDDREACTFTVTIGFIKVQHEPINGPGKGSREPIKQLIDPHGGPIKGIAARIVEQLHLNPHLSYDQLAELVGIGRSTVMRHVQALKNRGALRRVGPKKTGYWELTGMGGSGTNQWGHP